jgi:4-alpha-glucanotransferase
MTPDLLELCALTGVRTEYRDQLGEWRKTEAPTARAILTAMGYPAGTDAEAAESVAGLRAEAAGRRVPAYAIVVAGEAAEVAGADVWEIETEGGEVLAGEGRLPLLPMGIHRLTAGGSECVLIAAPATLPLPPRAWGVTLPLYGLRTAEAGGLGDFADLGRAVRVLSGAGAAFAGINPIHAGFFPDAGEFSPYAPSHRRRFNAACIPVRDEAARGEALVDYRASHAARWRALEAEFAGGQDAGFDAFVAAGGAELRAFAVHQAIAEAHGPYWDAWPEALKDRASPEVAAFAEEKAERVRFHMWLQYRAEAALAEVAQAAGAMRFGLYLDIAVGTHPFGAETWLEPECFARGVSIGAPPDAFSKDGQVWGLAPLNPRGLIAAGFRPVAEMLRQQFRFSKLIRIDHILGFDRAFWVPSEAGVPGAYVAMPKDALLAVARIEAARAGGTIIGEDLGNIPDGLHADLEASGLLGCRVVMFELNHNGAPWAAWDYPERVLASFGTHDLPTWAGWREGRDIAARAALGAIDAETEARAMAHRAWEVGLLDRVAGGGDVAAMERFVGSVHARLVALQIEDILDIKDQPNLPGTVHEYPNWRRRLPLSPDAWGEDARLARAARTMAEAGRATGGPTWNG